MQPSASQHDSSSALSIERIFSASPQQLFAAFEQAHLLARWWGPDGFTNTFEQFEFKPNGRWVFTMHGPNGADHHNEHVFKEIVSDRKIVTEHVVKPWFRLKVTFTAQGENQTHLSWVQEFESAEFLEKIRGFLETANRQVLDRLDAVIIENL